MTELKLYPRKSALIKGILCGIGSMIFGAMFTLFPDGDTFAMVLGPILLLVGLVVIAKSVFGMIRPKPCFVANADGFSILGKAARPWSDYNGIKVHTVTVSYVIKIRSLHFKVGSGLKTRLKGISWMHMSGKAIDMAAEIEAFAEAVQMGAVPAVAHDAISTPVVKAQQPVLMDRIATKKAASPELDLAAAFRGDNGGPIVSTPSLRERVFGGRKAA